MNFSHLHQSLFYTDFVPHSNHVAEEPEIFFQLLQSTPPLGWNLFQKINIGFRNVQLWNSKKNARHQMASILNSSELENAYSAFDQSLMCLFPSATNLLSVAATSKSFGAENVQERDEVSQLMSETPETPASAPFTDAAQPPQVMPGSLRETV